MEENKNPFEDFTVVTSLNDLGADPDKELVNETNDQDLNLETEDPKPSEVELPEDADPKAVAYYELLKEEGLISVPEDYKFNGTFEGIKQAQEYTFQQQMQYAQEQLLNSMPERLRDVVQAGINGVDDIDELLNLKKGLETSIDISSEKAQKSLIRRELSGTISEDDLDELIEMYVDKGKLKTEAEKILNRKQEQTSQRIQQMQQEAQQQRQLQEQQMQQFVSGISQEINSQKWDQTRKQTVMNEISGTVQGTPVIEAKLQRILSDPKQVVVLADFLTYYDGSKFDLDKYRKLNSLEAENLKDKWASKLSDTPVTLKQRNQNRGAVNLEDFDIFPG